jgi:hypothetical protein
MEFNNESRVIANPSLSDLCVIERFASSGNDCDNSMCFGSIYHI